MTQNSTTNHSKLSVMDDYHSDLVDEGQASLVGQQMGKQAEDNHNGDGKSDDNFHELAQKMATLFASMPFLQFMNVSVSVDDKGRVRCELDNRAELIGNPMAQILHGGVTASLLDTIGGLVAMIAVGENLDFTDPDQTKRFSQFATLDMRVDYLKPGRGERFIATGEVVRIGRKSCTTRMTLTNDKDELIAIGTGSYVY